MKISYRWKGKLAPYAFLAPALIFLLIFSIWPLFDSIYLSFFRFNLMTMDKKLFAGLSRYIAVLQDHLFHVTMFNTIYFSIGNVIIGGACALFLAILVNRIIKPLRTTIRTIAYLPVITSMVAAAILWKWIYDPRLGLLNYFLQKLGLPPQAWLKSSLLAMPSVIVMNVWKSVGYRMILFLAGLQNIPLVYYEAAEIDGANRVQLFRYITWPLLQPTVIFVLITSFIFSFQVFTQVFVMTNGGPGDATRTIVQYIYDTAFFHYHVGLGCTMSVLLLAVIMGITLLNFKISGSFSKV